MNRTLNVRTLLILVGVAAAALGTMRVATDLVTKSVFTALSLVFLGCLAGAIIRRTPSRVGFAVFAWGYLLLINFMDRFTQADDIDLSKMAITAVADKFHDDNLPEVKLPDINKTYISSFRKWRGSGRGQAYALGFDSTDDGNTPDYSMLKAGEIEQMKRYEADRRAKNERSTQIQERNQNAKFIGLVWMAILFGILGLIFGQFLGQDSRPSRPETNSSPI